MEKKIGRPTTSPKDHLLQMRMDKKTLRKLNECNLEMGIPKAEIIRQAIAEFYDRLQQESDAE